MSSKENLLKLKKETAKDIGDDKVYLASEVPPVEVVSTGSLTIDYATGIGGIPRGTLVEIFGRESAGKTALLYYFMREEQKKGRYVGYVNLEGRFDPVWAYKIAGLDPEGVLVVSPDPGTASVQTLAKMVRSGTLGLVGFDSIGAMLADKEQDEDNAKQAYGQSGLVTHMVKLINRPAMDNLCTVVFLNQIRDIAVGNYTVEESPGGHAVKHQSSIRIHLKPGPEKKEGIVDGEKVQIGYQVVALIKKNKLAAPRQKATFTFWNYPSPNGVLGIDRMQEVLDLSFRYDIISRAGASYRHEVFPDGKLVGKEAVIDYLGKNEDAFEIIRMQLMNHSSNTIHEPEREMLVDA